MSMNCKLKTVLNKDWIRGGLKGIVVCIVLFLFYIWAYFPVIEQFNDVTPTWAITLPMITGHYFLLGAHFLIEGSSLIPNFCKSEPFCYQWTAKEIIEEEGIRNCDFPSVREGVDVCCAGLDYSPKEGCAEKVELFGFLSMALILLSIYFLIGAGIIVISKKMRNK